MICPVKDLGEFVTELAENAISESGAFFVAISGGSLPKLLHNALKGSSIDFSKVHLFFVDERLVKLDHDDSNFKASLSIIEDYKIPKTQVYPVNQTLLTNPDECAKDYSTKLQKAFNTAKCPIFDLCLLGMGPDGHTASLFPGHPLLKEQTRWVAPITDSPKPPPNRITLTYPVLNNAKVCAFVCTGESKAPILKKIIDEGSKTFPAGLVKPTSNQLYWFLDNDAGKMLSKDNWN